MNKLNWTAEQLLQTNLSDVKRSRIEMWRKWICNGLEEIPGMESDIGASQKCGQNNNV